MTKLRKTSGSRIYVGSEDISVYILSLLQQTNTADMLDEAVEYVKVLQRQIEVNDQS